MKGEGRVGDWKGTMKREGKRWGSERERGARGGVWESEERGGAEKQRERDREKKRQRQRQRQRHI